MKACLLLVIAFLFCTVYANGQCGNNDKNGINHCSCDTCPKGGDPFNPYTGNEHRAVRDLEVWGTVGEVPLEWMRYYNSRGMFVIWTYSFQYQMADAGVNEQGAPRLTISYPEGGSNVFTHDPAHPANWRPLPGIDKRLF